MLGLGRIFRRSKQDAGEKAPNRESIHEPLIVSPTHAKDIMLDVSDPSAEDVVSIVNDLALKDVSDSSPKPTVSGKRKRQHTGVMDGSFTKRAAKGTEFNDTGDEYATTSINGVTRRQGRSSRTSSKVVKAAPGKLPRPKKEQPKRHMVKTHPAVQSSHDIWSLSPTPGKQAEKAAPAPTTPTQNPPNSEATPRPRGRPRRDVPSPIEKTTLAIKGQRNNIQKMTAKPGHDERPEGYMSPEIEPREACEVSVESSPQTGGPKAEQKALRTKTRSYPKRRIADRKSTRSVASANGQKDFILNANIDLTKKPERDARKAAKQARNLELASEAPAKKRDRTVARNAKVTKNPVRARARKASPKVQNRVVGEEHEEEEQAASEREEREERTNPVEPVDRDGQMSSYLDEREGGAEGEQEESVSESSTQVVENEEEAEEHEEVELFGEDRAWMSVLEGARSVCGSKLLLNHMPKRLTKPIRDLVHDVKEAREVYEQLLDFKGMEHDSIVGLNDDLEDRFEAIDRQIRGLSEERAAKKGSEMIRDIYARAIPAMVFLLQSALDTRIYHSDAPCDLRTLNCIVAGLEELIRLQNMAIEICEKAGTWKAKPATSRPIIWPTTRKMLPNLRLMRVAFSKKLLEQKRERKVKENAVKTAQKEKELRRKSQEASQEAARKNEIRNRKLRESIEEEDAKHRNAHPSYRQFRANEQARTQSQQVNGRTESSHRWSVDEDIELQATTQSQQVNGRIESSVSWTDDEDIELYIQLEKGYDPGLTSNERYLKILNARPLQNKLPEHIQERALRCKSPLLKQKGALEWITSIE